MKKSLHLQDKLLNNFFQFQFSILVINRRDQKFWARRHLCYFTPYWYFYIPLLSGQIWRWSCKESNPNLSLLITHNYCQYQFINGRRYFIFNENISCGFCLNISQTAKVTAAFKDNNFYMKIAKKTHDGLKNNNMCHCNRKLT